MGTLLDKPITEKEHSESGSSHGLTYGVSSMQGWRVDMEDAHCMQVNLDEGKIPGHSLFAGEKGRREDKTRREEKIKFRPA